MTTAVKEKLYTDLAWIWPVMSPPEDYIEEAEYFAGLIEKYAKSPVKTVLNLGCGGGHVDKTLKAHYKITGVDKSETMLELARKLNPEAEYFQGDMRTIRLGRLFDAVVVHDAISYMLSEDDLRAVFETAYAHLKPGGLFLTVVEETPEAFKQNKILHYSHADNGLEVTSIEYYYDPDKRDTTYEITFIYLIRQNKKLRVEVDNHICGIFPMAAWHRALSDAGFNRDYQERFHATIPNCDYDLLVAVRPDKP